MREMSDAKRRTTFEQSDLPTPRKIYHSSISISSFEGNKSGMRPGDKHKAKASREYQKKHGLIPAKQSKKQKEKAAIAKLESNWDRYDDPSINHETRGLSLQELLGRAKAPSAFLTPPVESTFHPKYKYPVKIQDWEVALAGLDLSKLLKNVSVEARKAENRPEDEEESEMTPPTEEEIDDPQAAQKEENSEAEKKRPEERPSKEIEADKEETISAEEGSSSESDLEDWLDSVI
ncbi:Oidioi.mRNA.OKI2018_I69.XSR.g15192.t1.cds [Oikopleura dioica]|uniref:Oidioi.mRNA.OKI2018_I69.XSR.g15192.t1.cds n=1 Tax=Oikopleura dioica TaxID=34765 RepID=A0ABN7SJF9_OIKDI|nr:Oidioi.mRNA.OKI2018_I69.XSR.g15192.t1.cds [Oikopleura dioica]